MSIKTITIIIAGIFLVAFGTHESRRERLIWSDEFNYNGPPDSAIWNYELGDGCPDICGWGNNEKQIYTNDSKNVRVENGSLIIDAVNTGTQWTSGKLTSKGKKDILYGRIVFRAKLPKGVGSWPALWMLSKDHKTNPWPACGEIDIMEHVGKTPGIVQSALHTPRSFGDTMDKGSTKVETFNTEFHLYELNWTRKKMEFSVDGHVYYTFQPDELTSETWPFDKPFFIIMNIAMGGNLGGPAIDPALTLQRMEVDYVRIYQ